MAETQSSDRKLYTLSEISQRTGISMPTLQRYKKMYQSRIPAEGKGRKQRYPEESLPVFRQISEESRARRGRPRKDASAPRPAASGRGRGRKAAAPAAKRGRPRKAATAATAAGTAKPAAGRRGGRKAASGGRPQRSGNLLTLGQVSEQTGISYPTLVRYVRLHSNRLPSEGTGRSRRFKPEAVDVFRQLRSESGRGGRKPAAAKTVRGRGRAAASSGADAGTSKRLKALERAQQDLEKRFRGFVQSLQKLFR